MKIKFNDLTKNKWIQFIFILLLIIIPLYLLSFCVKKRVEKFTLLFNDNSQDWLENKEDFINLSSLGLDFGLGDTPEVKKYNTMNIDESKLLKKDDSEFKGSDNKDLLKQLMPLDQIDDKNLDKEPDLKNKILNNAINSQVESSSKSNEGQRGGVKEYPKPVFTDNTKQRIQNYIQNDTFKNNNENTTINPFGTCNFFNDSCPSDYTEMGSIGIQGLPSGMTLTCGNVSSGKPASFVAELSNGTITNVVVVDPGTGYNPTKKYSMTLEGGGGGKGAELEPVIGDDGLIKNIKVVKGGSGFKETPKITIENSTNSGKCTFCCKSSIGQSEKSMSS